ncbi:hypothetical protein KDM41_12645 [bacterium]|nr:hypothetical protein [bacterium]
MPRARQLLVPVLVAFACATAALAADPAPHRLVRIDISSPADADFVRANRGLLDVIHFKPGVSVDIAADARALAFLRASGRSIEVVEENLEASLSYGDKGVGFGIFHTRSESIAWMDSLHAMYPDVVSAKWSIGLSYEGREIYAFRVSDNPEVDENEPEILIDGLHHSREIMASEFPVMFAEYLAQNYGTDPEITWLVDNRELYVVPIVNPDGFVYNELTNPSGGGLWRKNRRPNGDGSYGVDLNRNYSYRWGYDNIGSSGDPSSETYRGPSPASEVEIQALTGFINSREIRTHDTVHTYSNLTLYPWGYVTTPTADDAVFDHMALEMTKFNGYDPGQPGDVLYDVNGGAFDWAYGDESKHVKFFSFSNEIGGGSDGFWPAESRRGPLFQDNLWPHIYLMRAAGSFVAVHTPVVLNAAKTVLPGQSAELSFTLENQSVYVSELGFDVTVATDDPWVQFTAATRTIGSLPSLGQTDLAADPLPFSVDPACPSGHVVAFTVTVHMADGDLSFPLSFPVGEAAALFSDDFETGTGAWTLTGLWGTSAAYSHSPSRSLTDTPAGNYGNDSATSATISLPLQATRLRFWHRYQIESNYDYGRVQVGSGGIWTTVASYTGTNTSWSQVDLDLSPYVSGEVQIRFLLETDYSVVYDGWYIDDVEVIGFAGGEVPPAPAPVAPIGVAVAPAGELRVGNVTDPLGQTLSYGFRVYADAACTQLVAAADDVAAGAGETAWTLPGLAEGDYWWRAWAGESDRRSLLCAATPFSVTAATPVGDGIVLPVDLRVLGTVSGSGAQLRLTLPDRQDVTVAVYDTRGARVRRLHSGSVAGGASTLVWDGRDANGRAVASGLYFVRMDTGREVRTGRVVIVR